MSTIFEAERTDARTQLKRHKLELAKACKKILDTYEGRITSRQIFYQLLSGGLVCNTENAYKKVCKVIREARRIGLIDWPDIEGCRCQIKTSRLFTGPDDLVEVALSSFDMDRWVYQPERVAVVCQKEELSAVIQPVCQRWQVPFVATRGYPSASLVAEAAVRLAGHRLLYYCDLDPEGLIIGRRWQAQLDSFAAGACVQRLALDFMQVEHFNLPPRPVKLTDARATTYQREHGDSCWELEALPPQFLQSFVESDIRDHIDRRAWEIREDEIEDARHALRVSLKGNDHAS